GGGGGAGGGVGGVPWWGRGRSDAGMCNWSMLWLCRVSDVRRSSWAVWAGGIMAVSGGIMQRLTGNPMASREVLGISSGSAFGVVLMLFLVPGNAFGWLLP
ncbi:iron chelate uptake ABC transporter family permease subunit, partial [Escherichia coli]|uniref:iron chelate uptake ABC transporter family permease subunit n=1 Tax=Escherichia coli TaxID=562 RepID=UPI001484E1DB